MGSPLDLVLGIVQNVPTLPPSPLVEAVATAAIADSPFDFFSNLGRASVSPFAHDETTQMLYNASKQFFDTAEKMVAAMKAIAAGPLALSGCTFQGNLGSPDIAPKDTAADGSTDDTTTTDTAKPMPDAGGADTSPETSDDISDDIIETSGDISETSSSETSDDAVAGDDIPIDTQSPTEQCNGIDDDGDGTTDVDAEGNPLTQPCVPQETVGECTEGEQICRLEGDAQGEWSACLLVGQTEETCDGKDNDCSGLPDDLDFGQTSCGTGACTRTVATCIAGIPQSCIPGMPGMEICDNPQSDNDCNGKVDDVPGYGALCIYIAEGYCATEGIVTCDPSPPNVLLDAGLQTYCHATQPLLPILPEVCNYLDDDCNGTTDDTIATPDGLELGADCSTGVGTCTAVGFVDCGPNGDAVCNAVAGQPALEELCNGQDDNCDGIPDEKAFAEFGQPCTVSTGACATNGHYACADDAHGIICTPDQKVPAGTPETCNDIDDDCNGETDEGIVGVGDVCVEGVGLCAMAGIVTCDPPHKGSSIYCKTATDLPLPAEEVCDGQDNDCDTETDEGLGHIACGVGACATTTDACIEGIPIPCIEGTPAPETCNGKDDDCDGDVDEEIAGVGNPCAEGFGLCLTPGTIVCDPAHKGIKVYCQLQTEPPAPTLEICDGQDNDCDAVIDNEQSDIDTDGLCDAIDPDNDNDTVPNFIDNCPLQPNIEQTDTDDDGVGDACDDDLDGDGAPNASDNCLVAANLEQTDLDEDGEGDACDGDIDGDHVANEADNCPTTPNFFQSDWNFDGLGNACQDSDNDGVFDLQESGQPDNCLTVANAPQTDDDQDGYGNACDPQCASVQNPLVIQWGESASVAFQVSGGAVFQCDTTIVPITNPADISQVSVVLPNPTEDTAVVGCTVSGNDQFGPAVTCNDVTIHVNHPPEIMAVSPATDQLGVLPDGDEFFTAANNIYLSWELSDPDGETPLCIYALHQGAQFLASGVGETIDGVSYTVTIPADILKHRSQYQWLLQCDDQQGGTVTTDWLPFATSEKGLVDARGFDEASGDLTIDSAGVKSPDYGTLTNFNVDGATSGWVAGVRGTALRFDGVDDVVTATDSNVLNVGTGDFTMTVWTRPKFSGPVGGTIVSHRTPTNGFELFMSQAGFPGLLGGTCGVNLVTENFSGDGWFFLAVKRADTALEFYINGALKATGACADNFANNAPLSFGCGAPEVGCTQHFSGILDEFKFYKRALSVEELTAQFQENNPFD